MRSDLEKFYKELRTDITEGITSKGSDKTKEDDFDGEIVNTSQLNDLINEAIMKKKD